jgi:hypothetical protein
MESRRDPILEADLREARRRGRLEAEVFERRLSACEDNELQDRLCRLASGADDSTVEAPLPRESSFEVLRLQRELERLSSFHRAVLHSRAWALIQHLRRPFGRAW